MKVFLMLITWRQGAGQEFQVSHPTHSYRSGNTGHVWLRLKRNGWLTAAVPGAMPGTVRERCTRPLANSRIPHRGGQGNRAQWWRDAWSIQLIKVGKVTGERLRPFVSAKLYISLLFNKYSRKKVGRGGITPCFNGKQPFSHHQPMAYPKPESTLRSLGKGCCRTL